MPGMHRHNLVGVVATKLCVGNSGVKHIGSGTVAVSQSPLETAENVAGGV
jgi:hypothetical protein